MLLVLPGRRSDPPPSDPSACVSLESAVVWLAPCLWMKEENGSGFEGHRARAGLGDGSRLNRVDMYRRVSAMTLATTIHLADLEWPLERLPP